MRIPFIVLLALLSCNSENASTTADREDKAETGATKKSSVEPLRDSLMIPDDLIAPSRVGEHTFSLPADTITANKNYVRYFVSRDSCCSDNVYIQWGNDAIKRMEIVPSVRAYRSYFIPRLLSESKEYLILWRGCATGCQALLFLPLNNHEKPRDIKNFVCYDANTATVVHQLENYEELTEYEFLEATHVKSGRKKRIRFKNRGIAAMPTQLIDSCRITRQSIYLRATVYDDKTQEQVTEEVELKNDF